MNWVFTTARQKLNEIVLMVSGPLQVHLFRIKWFWISESIDLNGYFNLKTFKTYTKFYDVYDQIL
jgi:hypothetical protein